MKLHSAFTVFLFLFFSYSCGSGNSSLPPPEPFGYFIEAQPPGTLEVADDINVKDDLTELEENFFFDLQAMEVTIINPASNYGPGHIFILEGEEHKIAVKVISSPFSQEGETTTYQVEFAAIPDILEGESSFDITLCPDLREATASGEALLAGAGNNPSFDEDGGFSLANFDLFKVVTDENGGLDPSKTTLMGFGDKDEEDFYELDLGELGSKGEVTGKILSGSFLFSPTFNVQASMSGFDYEVFQSVDAIVEYDVLIRLATTGATQFGFGAPLFPAVSLIVTAGTVPIELKLKIPAGFEFKSEGNSSVDIRFQGKYAMQLTMNYNSATSELPTFESQSEFLSDTQAVSEIGAASIQGTLYLEPQLSVRILGVFGPLVWLKPSVQGVLNIPLAENEDELFVGVQGGTGLVVNIPFIGEHGLYSGNLLGAIPYHSWDLLGPSNDQGNSNTPPMANNVWATTNPGATVEIQLDGTDLEQITLFYSLQSYPLNGTLGILNTLTGRVNYTSHENFLGTETLEYSVSDGYEESNIATVTIAVGDGSWFDGFEDGNSNGWTTIAGNTAVSNQEAFTGKYSLHCSLPQSSVHVLRQDFSASTGIYEAAFYLKEGSGWLTFQAVDSDNFYWAYAQPIGAGNPELHLVRVMEGIPTYLATVPATFEVNEWFRLTVKRFNNGDIEVYINGHLQIQANDSTIIVPGKLEIGVFDDAYIDDASFTSW